jgi:FkbM family methyltransferase
MIPDLRGTDGKPLTLGLRALRRTLVGGTAQTRRVARYLAWRGRLYRRLPEIEASYPDGRHFVIPKADANYSEIFTHGEYEAASTSLIPALLDPGDFAIDVGANHGWFSFAMASAVGPEGVIWSYEPVPPTITLLERNLRLNESAPIELRQKGLGAQAGTATVHLFDGLPDGHASLSTLERGDYVGFEIDITTLDDDLRGAPSAPVLIKMDVEGAELDVLRGASGLLENSPPIWLLEVNHVTSNAFGYEPVELLAELSRRAAYHPFRITPEGLLADHDPESAPGGTLWLCVPENLAARVRDVPGSDVLRDRRS